MVSKQGPSACSGKRLRFRQPGIKEMNIGVENHRGALPVWRRKKAYGSTGKSGMPPMGEKPGVSCRPKEKGGSTTAWSPVLSDRRGKENGKRRKGNVRHPLKRRGCLPASGTVFIKGNHWQWEVRINGRMGKPIKMV